MAIEVVLVLTPNYLHRHLNLYNSANSKVSQFTRDKILVLITKCYCNNVTIKQVHQTLTTITMSLLTKTPSKNSAMLPIIQCNINNKPKWITSILDKIKLHLWINKSFKSNQLKMLIKRRVQVLMVKRMFKWMKEVILNPITLGMRHLKIIYIRHKMIKRLSISWRTKSLSWRRRTRRRTGRQEEETKVAKAPSILNPRKETESLTRERSRKHCDSSLTDKYMF